MPGRQSKKDGKTPWYICCTKMGFRYWLATSTLKQNFFYSGSEQRLNFNSEVEGRHKCSRNRLALILQLLQETYSPQFISDAFKSIFGLKCRRSAKLKFLLENIPEYICSLSVEELCRMIAVPEEILWGVVASMLQSCAEYSGFIQSCSAASSIRFRKTCKTLQFSFLYEFHWCRRFHVTS